MKKLVIFLMCLCCTVTFFACGQDNTGSTGTGDSTQIEQETDDTSSASPDDSVSGESSSDGNSSDSSNNESNDSSDTNNGSGGVWTPPAKQ